MTHTTSKVGYRVAIGAVLGALVFTFLGCELPVEKPSEQTTKRPKPTETTPAAVCCNPPAWIHGEWYDQNIGALGVTFSADDVVIASGGTSVSWNRLSKEGTWRINDTTSSDVYTVTMVSLVAVDGQHIGHQIRHIFAKADPVRILLRYEVMTGTAGSTTTDPVILEPDKIPRPTLVSPYGIVIHEGVIYWTDDYTKKIQRANQDGSNVQDVIRLSRSPYGIAIYGEKIYWIEEKSVGGFMIPTIRRSNMDGSSVEDVAGWRRIGVAIGGIAIHDDEIYWTDSQGVISRANLDGSNSKILVRTTEPMAVSIYDNKIYWTSGYSYGYRLQRADLDGSNIQDLRFIGPGCAIAIHSDKIYWTSQRTVHRADLDGSNIQDLVNNTDFWSSMEKYSEINAGVANCGIVIHDDRMYWTEGERIRRANLDGSGVQDLITSGLHW